MADASCARCGASFTPRRKTATFCSDRCRSESRRHVVLGASATHIANAVQTSSEVGNSSTKTTSQNRYLDKIQNSSLSWICVNDVTWKLTDVVLLREPVSALLGSVSSARALAWVTRDCETEAWPPDHIKGAVASDRHVWPCPLCARGRTPGGLCGQGQLWGGRHGSGWHALANSIYPETERRRNAAFPFSSSEGLASATVRLESSGRCPACAAAYRHARAERAICRTNAPSSA